MSRLRGWLCDPSQCGRISRLLPLVELAICLLIIHFVRYTEIDWRAYMQQVALSVGGERNYSRISGCTGPLVYPAGHVYVYTALWWLTDGGAHVLRAQYVFAAGYVITIALVGRLYRRCALAPPFALLLLSLTAYRVHSIYVLRLFNDPVAMLLVYACANCLLEARWLAVSVLFSLAVSVKMNVLLMAPALLLLFVQQLPARRALLQLCVCACVQLVVGAPFWREAPFDYVAGAFNLARVFDYRWTVNWRLVAERVFVDRRFHLLLLAVHVAVLAAFCAGRWWPCLRRVSVSRPSTGRSQEASCRSCRSCRLLVPLFTCNLVGVALSRSLHYQFYVWYYHSWPLLLWSGRYYGDPAPGAAAAHSSGAGSWGLAVRLALWLCLELCWNQYPSTVLSSAVLHCCHATALTALWLAGCDAYRCGLCKSRAIRGAETPRAKLL